MLPLLEGDRGRVKFNTLVLRVSNNSPPHILVQFITIRDPQVQMNERQGPLN